MLTTYLFYQLACIEGDLEKVEKLLFSISEQSQETAAMTCWEIATNFYKEVKLTTFLIL